ncbi:MAG: protein kinase [Minicystis sp.]
MARCPRCGARSCTAHGAIAEARAALPADDDVVRLERAGFRVVRLLGSGGFGAVLQVVRASGGAAVAVKIAHRGAPLAEARLLREAEALAAIGPPHVPAFHGVRRLDDRRPFIVMELIGAPTLATRLAAAAGPMAPKEVGPLAAGILRALEAAHGRGFAHRDLKPENVFVRGGAACLVDFGLARRLAPADAAITEAGMRLGTPEYMAPEQCEARPEIDARADIYAMGVVLFEMLAGRPPFWGSRAEVEEQHRSRRPPRPSEIAALPPAIDEVVLRCLAKDPADRFQSATDLALALDAAIRAAVVTSRPPPPPRVEARRDPAPARERRAAALLFFTSEAEISRAQTALGLLGGQLAFAAAPRFVAVFDHDAGDNPARRAVGAARALLADGVCAGAVVDLLPVSVQRRADGTRRYQSPLFAEEARFPQPGDPAIVLAGPAVAERVPEYGWVDLPDRAGLARIDDAPMSEARPPVDGMAGPLLGRDGELAQLVATARRVVADRAPAVACVLAEPGHGKSHLARALAERLREGSPEALILALRARDPADGSPERTRFALLQPALDLPAVPPPDEGRALLEARLGAELGRRAWPGIAVALGWAGPDDSGMRGLSAAPGALRSEAAHAVGEVLRWAAARRPLFVLLDDAHLADEVTLDALEHAAQAGARAPIFVVALGRPAFADARPGFGDRAEARAAMILGPLAPEPAAALCRELLRPVEDVPAGAVERLVEMAQAVPLFLVELVRCLKREGAVRRHGRGDAWYLAADELTTLPDLPIVEWLARRELDAMPPDLAAHARLASLLGAEITAAEVAGVLRVLDRRGEARELRLDGDVALRRLVAAGLLVEHGAGHLAFRHALVREAVARAVPPALRLRLHRAAFEHHCGGHDVPARADDGPPGRAASSPGSLAQLAFHAAQAGFADAARDAYFALAERARERHAYLDAGAHYTSALAQPGEAHQALCQRALRGRGLVRYRLGRYDDALADLGRARAIAHARGDALGEADILLDEATLLDWMDSFRASLARVEEAEARAAGLASPLLRARLLLGLGRSRHRFNQEAEASALLERAAAAAADLGDEGYETRVIALIVLGFVLPGLGRLDDAERVLDRAVAEAGARADRLHLFAALNNRALAWGYRDDEAQMIATFSRMLEIARDLGQSTMELVAHFNLGEYLCLMGDREAARRHVDRAAAIERRLLGDAARPIVALLRARLHLHDGDVAGAGAVVQAIRAQQAAARDRGQTEALILPAEDVLCAAVELATAGADEAAWRALEDRSAEVSIGQERIEVIEIRSLALRRAGRRAEARAQLERALALAATIPNVLAPRLRRDLAALG